MHIRQIAIIIILLVVLRGTGHAGLEGTLWWSESQGNGSYLGFYHGKAYYQSIWSSIFLQELLLIDNGSEFFMLHSIHAIGCTYFTGTYSLTDKTMAAYSVFAPFYIQQRILYEFRFILITDDWTGELPE